ncbi:MAG: ABC transporter permease, partial [Lachnospiraceae bacterium]|nr:ABC transporter permease [Lachnospiraceae bacterium]
MLKEVRATFVMVHECIVMSIDNILGNRMRSFLTLLGIMIGVAAVIALISTVDGVSVSMSNKFLELGANTLTVSITGTDEKTGMTPEDLQKIIDLEEVDGIVPMVTSRAYIVSNGKRSDERLTVAGKNGYYFQITEDLLERGRILNALDDEYRTWVCMVSQDVVDEFFFAKDPIGQTVYINGLPFEIVGLYDEDDGGGVAALFTGKPAVLIPYTAAMRLNSTNVVTSFSVYMTDGYASDTVQEAIENTLDPIF